MKLLSLLPSWTGRPPGYEWCPPKELPGAALNDKESWGQLVPSLRIGGNTPAFTPPVIPEASAGLMSPALSRLRRIAFFLVSSKTTQCLIHVLGLVIASRVTLRSVWS